MPFRSIFAILVCIGFQANQSSDAAHANQPDVKIVLAAADEKAVEAYLRILRGCCMEDGGITMVDHGPAASSPVWVAPYFGDHVALALIAANDFRKSDDDIARVRRWIEWRVKRQEPGGFWYDHTGTKARYASNGKVDAHDSSAALFLLVLERYQRAGGDITDEMVADAKRSLNCIARVTDRDGLTWAKPTYKVKYFMDNIEVYAGLKSAEILFSKTKDAAESRDCGARAAAIGKLLPGYFGAKEKDLFAWALHPDGAYDGGMDRLYPHGLAQLFGVAFVKPNDAAFRSVVRRFTPESGPAATGAERLLVAASRLGGERVTYWREAVVKDDGLRESKTTYSYRTALAVLALLEGADWMPSLCSLSGTGPESRRLRLHPPTVETDNWGIRGRIVGKEIRPRIKRLAGDQVEVVDVYGAFEGKRDRDLHSDGVHPNAEEAALIAETLRAALLKAGTSRELTAFGNEVPAYRSLRADGSGVEPKRTVQDPSKMREAGRGTSRGRQSGRPVGHQACRALRISSSFSWIWKCGGCPMRVQESRARCRATRSTLTWKILVYKRPAQSNDYEMEGSRHAAW